MYYSTLYVSRRLLKNTAQGRMADWWVCCEWSVLHFAYAYVELGWYQVDDKCHVDSCPIEHRSLVKLRRGRCEKSTLHCFSAICPTPVELSIRTSRHGATSRSGLGYMVDLATVDSHTRSTTFVRGYTIAEGTH